MFFFILGNTFKGANFVQLVLTEFIWKYYTLILNNIISFI